MKAGPAKARSSEWRRSEYVCSSNSDSTTSYVVTFSKRTVVILVMTSLFLFGSSKLWSSSGRFEALTRCLLWHAMVDTLGITVVHVSARRQYAGHCRREQPCGRKTPDLTPAGTRPAYMSHQLFCWFPSPSYLQSDAAYLSCDGALGQATWTAALVTALGRRRSLPRSCAFTLLRARTNTGRAAIDPISMSVASATDSR